MCEYELVIASGGIRSDACAEAMHAMMTLLVTTEHPKSDRYYTRASHNLWRDESDEKRVELSPSTPSHPTRASRASTQESGVEFGVEFSRHISIILKRP